MDNKKANRMAILTIIVCVICFLFFKHAILDNNKKLSDRVSGTYTSEYDITYAVDEALESSYNIDIDDGDDEVHFNAEIILMPDNTFTLTFDTNLFNEELLDYCSKIETRMHINIDEFTLRSYMSRYLNDLFKQTSGTYEVDGDEISFTSSGLSGLHADRRSNSSFNLYFILSDRTEFWMSFYK